jgi:hypothetical protein
LNSTPAVLPVITTGPETTLPRHGPVAASPPTTTRPVLPVIVTCPVTLALQSRTRAAPVATTGPETIPPSTMSEPPGLTVTGPVTLVPGATQVDCPASTVTLPVTMPARQPSVVTVNVVDAGVAGWPARSVAVAV